MLTGLIAGGYLQISHGHRSMISSERRSAIIKTVGLIAALTRSGMMDASMTLNTSHVSELVHHCHRVGRRAHFAGAANVGVSGGRTHHPVIQGLVRN